MLFLLFFLVCVCVCMGVFVSVYFLLWPTGPFQPQYKVNAHLGMEQSFRDDAESLYKIMGYAFWNLAVAQRFFFTS